MNGVHGKIVMAALVEVVVAVQDVVGNVDGALAGT